MSADRVDLVELREFAEGVDVDATMFGGVEPNVLLALVEAVEAARALYEIVEMDESVGVCLSDRVVALRLREKLARFDFGEGGA